MKDQTLSTKAVLRLAWPLILANITTPLLGLVDTAVLGNSGSVVDLAAISLGSLIFSFLYWSFGFLRMTTTGFVARASGSDDGEEVLAAVCRAVLIGGVLGSLIFVMQGWIVSLALQAFSAGQAEELAAGAYFEARIWGAPAALLGLGCVGLFIGLRRTKEILYLQLFTNGLNIGLDIVFVHSLDLGVVGVGYGTAISEWMGAILSIALAWRVLAPKFSINLRHRIFAKKKLLEAFRANRDVMIRTMCLIFGFAYFTNQSGKMGEEVLAANHLLLQVIAMSAFFLDGFANVAEAKIGAAIGANKPNEFSLALRRTSQVAVAFALTLALGILLFGDVVVHLLTTLEPVRIQAKANVSLAALYVACSVAAFQLDGVFIGATASRAMRNSALISILLFIGLAELLVGPWQNRGLWWAFIAFVTLRGCTLAALLPALQRSSFARSAQSRHRLHN